MKAVTLVLGFILSLSQVSGAELPDTSRGNSRPNFIIILADDLGYGDLSCYGNGEYQTPHLDRLAREGLRFTDFHSSGPVCSPTRAGLLTGRYQQRSGIPGVINADPAQNRHHGLHPHEITFSRLLKQAGYRTGIFGKWHLGYHRKFNPVHHGFDRFRGYVSGNIDYLSHYDRMGIADWWENLEQVEEEGYSTHLITRHAVMFIEKNRDRPFCLYVAHEAPHGPYQGPSDKPSRAAGKIVSAKQVSEHIQPAYREMVQEMDKGIGELVATVNRLKLEEKTFIFFFSDNGANKNGKNGPLRGWKGSVWEGGHRVPAIAWWPGRMQAGGVTGEPAISIDLLPTMLELAGVPLPEGHHLDGRNLLPVLLEGKSLGRRTLFWDYAGNQAVRDGAWKLVVEGRGTTNRGEKKARFPSLSLFHLDRDLREQKDLASQQPERVESLRKALRAWQEDVARKATRQPARGKGELGL